MSIRRMVLFVCVLAVGGLSPAAFASNYGGGEGCVEGSSPVYSNVEFTVEEFFPPDTSSTVKAVLTQPVEWVRTGRRSGCYMLVENPPAVVILHGSAGMDTRNAFYGQALKRRYATLSVEMFPAGSERPPLPAFNYSYAFGALKYLIESDVAADPEAVGCLGFSWGGVICNQVAVELYAVQFGDDLYDTDYPPYRFAAHVANYPVCWARNIPGPTGEPLLGSLFGGDDAPLTGKPLLVQVGGLDAYDNEVGGSGSEACIALAEPLTPDEEDLLEVVVFDGAYHGFDRLFAVPVVVRDQFARLGIGVTEPPENWPEVPIIPDQEVANRSRRNVLRFFRRNLLYH